MEQKIIAVVAGREIKESDFEKFLQNVPREQQAEQAGKLPQV